MLSLSGLRVALQVSWAKAGCSISLTHKKGKFSHLEIFPAEKGAYRPAKATVGKLDTACQAAGCR